VKAVASFLPVPVGAGELADNYLLLLIINYIYPHPTFLCKKPDKGKYTALPAA
jgi:hypothetical protein